MPDSRKQACNPKSRRQGLFESLGPRRMEVSVLYLSGSVGRSGRNLRSDVLVVQRLLARSRLPPLRVLKVDGVVGRDTIAHIEHFQLVVVKMSSPDGRIDADGRTWRHLVRYNPERSESASNRLGNGASAFLSGAKWWRRYQGKFPNRRGLEYLEEDFRQKATAFVTALRKAGASVSIGTTRRSRIRAHLMHYSWRLARGEIRASDIPSLAGLQIEWDHGDEKASRRAAQEMVQLFNMAHIASLSSNHIRGKAIDMTISWQGKGDLAIAVPGQAEPHTIRSIPRNGAKNRELHRIGAKYGVKKLLGDAPHWSHNGR